MWLKKLQIAIIERDEKKLEILFSSPFESNNADEIEQAQFLLLEAIKVLQELKDETKTTMIQLKKNIDFLNSTQPQTHNKLDIRS